MRHLIKLWIWTRPRTLQNAATASTSQIQMTIGRLHAIQNWDTASTSSVESDDLPSLTDAEWEDLEDSQYRLNPLWPQNISHSLPPELQPFLLSRPVHRQRPQDNQTNLTRDDEKDDCIRGESSLFGSETAHSMSEETSLFGDEGHCSEESSLFGDEDHTEGSSLFGDSDQTDYSINEASTPASLPQDRMSLPNVGFQPPVGQHYAWASSHVGLQHPAGQHYTSTPSHVGLQSPAGQHYPWIPSHVGLQHSGGQPIGMQSSVEFQSLPGPHYQWMPTSQGASGTPMMSPSTLTYPYAINTAFPPSTQFYPSANVFTAPPLTTSSFGHRAYQGRRSEQKA
ncbi:hypothetical protein BDR04DRAFT_315101 [Suillus decipiens]|nr:hypothetical protein BDR04DRAFT_315101 [Suillus decipiens]